MAEIGSRIPCVLVAIALLGGCAPTLEDARMAREQGRLEEAVTIWERLAEQGNATAALRAGRAYEQGKGVDQDIDRAEQFYWSAARDGNAEAQYWLARLYHDGEHRERDHELAREWFGKSVEQGFEPAIIYDQAYNGNTESQYQLGLRTHPVLGAGTAKAAYALSWYWFEKAATQGDDRAQRFHEAFQTLAFKSGPPSTWNPVGQDAYQWNALGDDLYSGANGIPRAPGKAGWWYRRPAEAGNTKAQYKVGLIYKEGKGVPANADQAVGWFRKAAEEAYAPAQYELGMMYAQGRGVAQDREEATTWMRKAARRGNEDAKQFLREQGD